MPIPPVELIDAPEVVAEVRPIMWEQVGLIRDESGLTVAINRLKELERRLGNGTGEAANMVEVARLIAVAARDRTESRGAHYRRDYPKTGKPRRRTYAERSLATVA